MSLLFQKMLPLKLKNILLGLFHQKCMEEMPILVQGGRYRENPIWYKGAKKHPFLYRGAKKIAVKAFLTLPYQNLIRNLCFSDFIQTHRFLGLYLDGFNNLSGSYQMTCNFLYNSDVINVVHQIKWPYIVCDIHKVA